MERETLAVRRLGSTIGGPALSCHEDFVAGFRFSTYHGTRYAYSCVGAGA